MGSKFTSDTWSGTHFFFPRSEIGRYADLIDRQLNETVHPVPTVISQA